MKTATGYTKKALKRLQLGKLLQADLEIAESTHDINHSPDPDAYAWRGLTHAIKGNPTQAIEDLNAAIRLTPEDAELYSNRASVYGDQGKYPEALRDYSIAIKMNPQHSGPYVARGLFYLETTEEYAKARSDFDLALEREPDNYYVYCYRADANIHMRRFKAAAKDIGRALRLAPRFSGGLYLLGYLHAIKGRYKPALKALSRASKLPNPFPMIHLARSLTYMALKNPCAALKDVNEFLEHKVNAPEALVARAAIYEQLGRRAQAEADYRCVMGYMNLHKKEYVHRGWLYEHGKDYPHALWCFQQAKGLNEARTHLKKTIYKKVRPAKPFWGSL